MKQTHIFKILSLESYYEGKYIFLVEIKALQVKDQLHVMLRDVLTNDLDTILRQLNNAIINKIKKNGWINANNLADDSFDYVKNNLLIALLKNESYLKF